MKRKLIIIMVVALTTWGIRAALNPHITELDLNIDGVADYDEFYEPSPSITPKGPGGFVCSNGWKMITLKAVGVNDPMKTRLNWNSFKIEVWTATNGGTQVSSPTLWDPASSMPTQLWVKGVSASATGPTKDASGNWTNCGPEHITLEAINNGADPTTPGTYYDRIAFTVYQVDSITVMPKNVPVGWTPPVPVTIGAGAIHSPAHQADVTIQVQPTVAGIPIDVSLSGGLSYQPGKAAELVMGTQAATGGCAVVTVLTGTNGTISGELTSSDVNNMKCWIHASATETNVVFTWDEYFEQDEWTFEPGYLPVPGVLTNHLVLRHHRDAANCTPTNITPWEPFNDHDIRFFVEKVEYWDADGNLCETNNTATAPADVSAWATFPTNPVTTDANGRVTELLTIVTNANLKSVTMVAYDWSVWVSPAPAAPVAPISGFGFTALAAPSAPSERPLHTNESQEMANQVDLVIDSDNNDGYGEPSGGINEINKEDEAGWPGKALALNELDRDGDGTPDFADGYDSGCGAVSHALPLKSAVFVPMMLKIPASVNKNIATVSFTSGTATDVFSNPEKVVQTGNGTSTSPFVCPITDKGKIRIWTRNGTSLRSKLACPAGDWVQPNNPILVSDLPIPDSKGNIKLFVEAVQGSKNLGDVVIKVELDPDGSTGLEPKTSDQVVATVFHIEEVHPITSDFADGQSGKILISTRQDDLYYTTASTTAAGKPAQTMDTNVTISAYIIPVPPASYPDLKAYFEVIDPDDRSHYEGKPAPGTPTVQGDVKPNDNRDPIKRITWELDGTSKGYHEYQKECLSTRWAAPVFVPIGGVPRCVAETTLLTTDRHSGDNYRIRATLRDPGVGISTYIPCFDTLSAEGSNVVSTIKQSETLIAWKRVYIEQDEMYTLGCTITNAAALGDQILEVDSSSDLAKDMLVTIFWNGGSLDTTIDGVLDSRRVQVPALSQSIPVSSGIRPLNHTATVTISQQYLPQAFGSLPDGSDGGAFIEFKPVPSGSGKTPKYKYMPGAPQDRFIDYYGHWFDNKSQFWSNVLYLLAGHDAQDNGWCKPIASVCIVLTVGRTEMSQRETVVHEIGHRFVRESDVGKGDYAYLEKLTNKKSHDGSEYCVMNYSNGLAPNGITEFSIEYLLTGSAPTEKNSLRDCEDK